MKKVLFTFFLPLCIILLSGYSQLKGHVSRDAIADSSSKLCKKSEKASFDTKENDLPFIKKLTSDKHKTFIVDAVEVREVQEEEYELSSSKKNRKSDNHLAALFCVLTRGYFFNYIRETLSFRKDFSEISAKHLILQVLRI